MRFTNLTIDQLKALSAIEATGSIIQASKLCSKSHTSILYGIDQLEAAVGFKVLDRSQYRVQLTKEGHLVLEKAKQVFRIEEDIFAIKGLAARGWEAEIKIVYDGLMDPGLLLKAASKIRKQNPSTRIFLFSDYLSGVEERFNQIKASAMVTLLTSTKPSLTGTALKPIKSFLVAHVNHPLAKGKHTEESLSNYPLLTVRSIDERLDLPTKSMSQSAIMGVADFHTKREAIIHQYGYGWLPQNLIASDLKLKRLKVIQWNLASEHTFTPIWYEAKGHARGRALDLMRAELQG
jgi:DNA-binding transcriptional LysR family regulator